MRRAEPMKETDEKEKQRGGGRSGNKRKVVFEAEWIGGLK